MEEIHTASCCFNSIIAFTALRSRLELAPEGGWYCILRYHGWLCGDRRQALREFELVERIERLARP